MAKSLNRKKPGYTKAGEVKIVSLSYRQLQEMLDKASKPKIKNKIQNRMRILAGRKGFVAPVVEESQAVSE